MISCRVVSTHVDALVDGELDTPTQVEFDSHLAVCARCREEAALTRGVKAATRRALGDVRAPDALRQRLLAALEATPVASPTERLEEPPAAPDPEESAALAPRADERSVARRPYVVAARLMVPAAAAAVVFAAFAAQESDDIRRPSEAAVQALPFFEDVVRRHANEHPMEVRGSEGEVSQFFRGRLGFQARPVVFRSPNTELVGARLSNVREQDAAAFYYDVDGHRVTVFVFERPSETRGAGLRSGAEHTHVGDQDVYYRRVHGYTVPVVERGGLTYAFTGDLDTQSMIQLAASAQPAN